MAMLIAWQTMNAVRRPNSQKFTRGFLIVAPGLTIRDRLRVLQPHDPDSYYASRELIPSDMLGDLERAKIVITNYHAFRRRERMELSKGGRSLLQGRGEERLTAEFNDDSVLELTPDLIGPSITRNAGIIGEDVELSLEHLEDMRRSTLLFHITQRLLYTKWRDPGEEPKLYLFGQLKRITKQWLDTCLVCKGGTYPAQLMYQELADMACERITAGITRALVGERPIKALLDPYNPTGSTIHVNFTTSKTRRWQTDARRCHINWVILDSDWEAEFCRIAESHPRVKAYVKNHNLGLEVPYRYGSETRTYIPDFIVLVDDGHGDDDLLHLIVEIKGYRREDAKEKKATMETYWVPGVNHLGKYGRWAFAEFTEVYRMQTDFEAKVEAAFHELIAVLLTDKAD
jgi:type III restriction enzyme